MEKNHSVGSANIDFLKTAQPYPEHTMLCSWRIYKMLRCEVSVYQPQKRQHCYSPALDSLCFWYKWKFVGESVSRWRVWKQWHAQLCNCHRLSRMDGTRDRCSIGPHERRCQAVEHRLRKWASGCAPHIARTCLIMSHHSWIRSYQFTKFVMARSYAIRLAAASSHAAFGRLGPKRCHVILDARSPDRTDGSSGCTIHV